MDTEHRNVVAIGASAGGVEALQSFFEGVWGRGLWRKAAVLSYLAQIHLRLRFAVVFGRPKR